MGFIKPDLPPVDTETFLDRPFQERIKALSLHWVEYGFGSPTVIHTIYLAKLLVLYAFGGAFLASWTSGLGPVWSMGAGWSEPVFYQKLVLWTMLLEVLGVGGSWGPLAGHFKPMTGGALYWMRPRTIRLPPWPGKVPFTAGDSRSVGDVLLYAVLVANLLAAVLAPPHDGLVRPALLYSVIGLLVVLGLRDKVVFLAARGEQYLPAVVFFAFLGATDMIVALKLLIVVVWIGAGFSKFGRHFSHVVPPMVSNGPLILSRALKRAHYRDFPRDIRPSALAHGMAHVGGTLVECVTPLVLLFSTDRTVTLLAVALMVVFHAFIASTFPLAVPLEWNVLFGFAAVFLFWGHPAWQGYGVGDMSSPWLTALITAGLLFFPVLGNLRPDLVSFLPSMRQYAGNWASATWAFAPGAEEKLNRHIVRSAPNQLDQLRALGYPDAVAEIMLQQTLGWRAMHSQGRALFSLMLTHLDDIDRYTLREAEFMCNGIVGWNFGDGHLHDERLIEAIQRRCRFAPGEMVVAWVESQPVHRDRQRYVVIDAALGAVERGTFRVKDAVEQQPWLPGGPIPFAVEWSRTAPSGGETAQEESVTA